MKSRDLARSIVADLRSRRLAPATIAEFARCVAIVHGADDFDFPRYASKLLHRHRNRPGPKIDLARKKRIAQAAIEARFNKATGKWEAARKAADCYKVLPSEVFEAAFQYKRGPMRALIRKLSEK